MSEEDILNELKKLPDRDLFWLIRRALEPRCIPDHLSAADGSGYPTDEARLVVIRHICCN